MTDERSEEPCPKGDRAFVRAKEGVMPVEQREAGRWKRERPKSGTNTVGSALEGSARWRDPCPMGMGGTDRLDRTHVGNPGNGD